MDKIYSQRGNQAGFEKWNGSNGAQNPSIAFSQTISQYKPEICEYEPTYVDVKQNTEH